MIIFPTSKLKYLRVRLESTLPQPSSRAHLCGLDINLTYPQTGGPFPPVNVIPGANQNVSNPGPDSRSKQGPPHRYLEHSRSAHRRPGMHGIHERGYFEEVLSRYYERERRDNTIPSSSNSLGSSIGHENWKRDLTGRSNNSIDPWYGCFLWDEMVDYAVNFTFPWSE